MLVGQFQNGKRKFHPSDWSSAFPISRFGVTSDVTISNCRSLYPYQPEFSIVTLLPDGVEVSVGEQEQHKKKAT